MLAFQGVLPNVVKMLLEITNIDVNVRSKSGYIFRTNTALMIAIMTRQLDIAKMLLQRNDIDLNLQNKQGITALMLTNKLFSSGDAAIIEMWIEFQERITKRSRIQWEENFFRTGRTE